MKGGMVTPAVKRRWKGFALAVLTLVVLSLLLPLVFLFGVQSRSSYGYLSDDQSPPGSNVRSVDGVDLLDHEKPKEGAGTRIVDRLASSFRPFFPEEPGNIQNSTNVNSTSLLDETPIHSEGNHPPAVENETHPSPSTDVAKPSPGTSTIKSDDETTILCQLQFGSYCLWSLRNKERMKDLIVKKIRDQLFVVRAYYPLIDKIKGQGVFSQKVKQNIQDHEHLLGGAMFDAELPSNFEERMQTMEDVISRSKSLQPDYNYVEKKMRLILDWAEEEAKFYAKQGAFLYQLSVQTVPKSLHCLSMRLTAESFKILPVDAEDAHAERLSDPDLQHYVIFSKNVLASSVAINSTVTSAKETKNLVFHLLTDSQNYFSMKFWFSKYTYKNAVIDVQNIEEFGLQYPHGFGMEPHLSMFEEFRIFIRNNGQPRIEHIPVFGHVHFLLPDLFKKLRKLVVLDDDIVVQKDLSHLWNLELKGKVIGAVEYCGMRLSHLKGMHGETNYNKDTCVWMSGLNVIDLDKWRELNLTGTYTQLLHENLNLREKTATSWRDAVLPTAMLTFQGLVHPLNSSWVLSGLGASYEVNTEGVQSAAVLHYNGNMKPWLELGVQNYKTYWKRFLIRGDPFMADCNLMMMVPLKKKIILLAPGRSKRMLPLNGDLRPKRRVGEVGCSGIVDSLVLNASIECMSRLYQT
ncbi:unnamed protein product [Spirodela intermedia]|uniref:Hexosyltransferase n=1 Tax=Spirodela intermedia TaxID=51605 RepID=A0A7I8KKG7_SPIIN|nr:unnamed protein product [Spirodela intermedia]